MVKNLHSWKFIVQSLEATGHRGWVTFCRQIPQVGMVLTSWSRCQLGGSSDMMSLLSGDPSCEVTLCVLSMGTLQPPEGRVGGTDVEYFDTFQSSKMCFQPTLARTCGIPTLPFPSLLLCESSDALPNKPGGSPQQGRATALMLGLELKVPGSKRDLSFRKIGPEQPTVPAQSVYTAIPDAALRPSSTSKPSCVWGFAPGSGGQRTAQL